MPFLSIIIPVYNVEQYLDECLSSIVNQTYTDWECICVNDGSTDKSAEVLYKYASLDKRITILEQENSGPSVARSLGMSTMCGKYVCFVDADDFLDHEALCYLVDLVNVHHLDVLGYSYRTVPNGGFSKYTMTVGKALRPSDLLSSTATPQASDDLAFVWRFLIRKELLDVHGINFSPVICVGEDTVFMMEVFSCAEKVYLTDYAPYNYRIDNEHSIMHEAKYKPYLESSLITQYNAKKQLIEHNRWDELTPFSFDLANRAVRQYSRMLMANRKANGEPKEQYISEVLNLPMIKDAMRIIGYRNIFTNWREYVVFLCMKFHFMPVLKRYF